MNEIEILDRIERLAFQAGLNNSSAAAKPDTKQIESDARQKAFAEIASHPAMCGFRRFFADYPLTTGPVGYDKESKECVRYEQISALIALLDGAK